MWLIDLFYGMTRKRKGDIPEQLAGEMMKKLGARIKFLREQKSYTSYELFAYQHDFSRSQYGGYERGENLTFLSLLKIVRAFGMTLPEFFSEGFD